MLIENLLKTFYSLGERRGQFGEDISVTALRQKRAFQSGALQRGLRTLCRRRWVEATGKDAYRLTPEGLEESKRVVRLHRLWELYLSERMNMAADHVHNTAEAIEHILTPEVEKALLEELDHPVLDPHQSNIPYTKSETN
jgi:manganese/zinc/iron transport system permease protein